MNSQVWTNILQTCIRDTEIEDSLSELSDEEFYKETQLLDLFNSFSNKIVEAPNKQTVKMKKEAWCKQILMSQKISSFWQN